MRRQAVDRLRAYYGAIGRAADDIAEYSEKQQFLKGIYEDFCQAYNPVINHTGSPSTSERRSSCSAKRRTRASTAPANMNQDKRKPV